MFAERVASNPLGFMSGCLVWIPVSIWVLSMVWWTIQGDVETGFGLLSIGVGITLGVLTVAPPVPSLSPLLFLLVVLTVIMFPFVRAQLTKHALAQIDIEEVESAYSQLQQRPDNLGAAMKLARVLHTRGMVGPAIAVAENALSGANPGLFREELRMVSVWKNHLRSSDPIQPLPCLRCGNENAPGTCFCASCGAPYLLDHAKGKWVGSGTATRLIASWLAAVLILAGIPMTAAALPPLPSVLLIVAEITLGVFVLVRAFIVDHKVLV